MDILRVLATPDSEVRKKTLSLVLDLVSTRNIEDIVQVLKKVCTFPACFFPISFFILNSIPTIGSY